MDNRPLQMFRRRTDSCVGELANLAPVPSACSTAWGAIENIREMLLTHVADPPAEIIAVLNLAVSQLANIEAGIGEGTGERRAQVGCRPGLTLATVWGMPERAREAAA